MLVLTRKKNESIRIDKDIYIKVIEHGNRGVRIGIDAPDHINIVRTELIKDKE